MKARTFAAAVFFTSVLVASAGDFSAGATLSATQSIANEKFNGDMIVVSYTTNEARSAYAKLFADRELRKFVASNFAVYVVDSTTATGADELNSLGAQGGGDRLVVVANRLNNLKSHRALAGTQSAGYLSFLKLVKSASSHDEFVALVKASSRASN